MVNENMREPQMGLTFEKVWAMFQETAQQFKETERQFKEIALQSKETERQFKDIALQSKETDRQFKETDRQFKEIVLQSKETDRKISKLGHRIGDLVEHIIAPNLLEKFNALKFNFGKMGADVSFKDSKGKSVAEVDVLLEDGDTAMAVEVKTKLTTSDVKEHTERMGKLRKYADDHNDKRDLIGAVAGAIVPENVKQFALKSGFFVIEQSGDTVKIDVPEDFVPKRW
ncbi:MAG: hypothetical protein LBF80_00285 [Spirochaetaceae bacterium]|jgi:hypothetical protein|nr:hypothetical protein [Spirochaetaceae bacterium]